MPLFLFVFLLFGGLPRRRGRRLVALALWQASNRQGRSGLRPLVAAVLDGPTRSEKRRDCLFLEGLPGAVASVWSPRTSSRPLRTFVRWSRRHWTRQTRSEKRRDAAGSGTGCVPSSTQACCGGTSTASPERALEHFSWNIPTDFQRHFPMEVACFPQSGAPAQPGTPGGNWKNTTKMIRPDMTRNRMRERNKLRLRYAST